MKTLSQIVQFFEHRGIAHHLHLITQNDWELSISEVIHDSRKSRPGTLFCCLPGSKADGHDFAAKAVEMGAVMLLCERELPLPVPQVIVENVRKTMGHLAAFAYDFPADKLKMIAVTGTNGKSTTTYMIRQMLEQAGIKTGLLGTIIYSDGEREIPGDRTTPESTSVQMWLRDMVKNGCQACVMEASSHGLEMGRLEGCLFDQAVFTNLTPEHLDYHGDMENYFLAKKKLFDRFMRGNWKASINADDSFGRRLLVEYPKTSLAFGITSDNSPQVEGKIGTSSLEGTVLDISLPEESEMEAVNIPFTGRYNAYNSLAAVTAGYQLGLDPETLRTALETLPQVPGRVERIEVKSGTFCIIDYAHSPDALEKVLLALKDVTLGKIWAVFGLGGERYEENRPAMGKIAATLADRIVLTMDNPRSEPPEKIAEQIAEGIEAIDDHPPYMTILDRKKAIFNALDHAEEGDVVMVGGKGPETYMIIGNQTLHYNDKETVLDWISSHREGKR